MSVEKFLLRKFLRFKGGGYISFLAGFTVFGIFLGVTALILVLGVMSGFHQEIKRRILGLTPHIVVNKFFERPVEISEVKDSLNLPEVMEVSPYIIIKAMVKHKEFVDGAVIRGISEHSSSINEYLKENIRMGKFQIGEGKVLVGWDLANRLRILPDDTLIVYSPFQARMTPFGAQMKAKGFVVAGIFDVGYFDYNATFIFSELKDAQFLMGFDKNTVQGYEIFLKDPYKAPKLSNRIEERLGYPFTASHWIEMNKSLFSALKLEKLAMFLVLILILFVASFNMMTTLLMLFIKKTKEIGILRSIGFTRKGVFRFFMLEGLYLGSIGIISGVIAGGLLGMLATRYHLIRLPPDIYFIDYLPISVKIMDIVWVVLVALGIVLFSTLYPSIKASRLILHDALRYE